MDMLFLALTYAFHKMIVSSVHLVLPLGPCGVRDAGAEPVRELPHQVIIEPVLERPQDDDRPRELQVDLLHGLVRQDSGEDGRAGSFVATAATIKRKKEKETSLIPPRAE